jgi:hypothetical protein
MLTDIETQLVVDYARKAIHTYSCCFEWDKESRLLRLNRSRTRKLIVVANLVLNAFYFIFLLARFTYYTHENVKGVSHSLVFHVVFVAAGGSNILFQVNSLLHGEEWITLFNQLVHFNKVAGKS